MKFRARAEIATEGRVAVVVFVVAVKNVISFTYVTFKIIANDQINFLPPTFLS